MPLSEAKVRNAKSAEKDFKLFDGDGLFLLVKARKGKWWRFKYRFGGKEKQLSFGTYPEVSLSEARDKRHEARKQVAAGVDPGEARKALKESAVVNAENSFEVVAREWFAKFEPSWSPSHARTIIRRLENDTFPWIGKRPIEKIKAPDLLAVLRRVESRGALETAHRIKTVCGQVFRYAVATGRAERDPSADLKGALPPANKKHLAAITDPVGVAKLLRDIDCYEGSPVVRAALQIAPLVFVRPGELRAMKWPDLDLENAEWSFLVTKTRTKHLVPLSDQAVEILLDLKPLTSRSEYVFPGHRSNMKPLSDNALNAALRGLGYSKEEMTTHGFRAMARTLIDEVLQLRPELVEHQLAHVVRDPLGRAYNRTSHLAERVKMMQVWADYLDGLKSGAKVIPIKRQQA